MGYPAYYHAVQTNALGAGDRVWANLWNPHATIALQVFYVSLTKRSTGTGTYTGAAYRTTTRGVGGASDAPIVGNHVDNLAAPPSGALLDTSVFTTVPTLETPELIRWQASGRPAGGIIWTVPIDDENGIDLDRAIIVPAGTGLALAQPVAGVTESMEVTFGWLE